MAAPASGGDSRPLIVGRCDPPTGDTAITIRCGWGRRFDSETAGSNALPEPNGWSIRERPGGKAQVGVTKPWRFIRFRPSRRCPSAPGMARSVQRTPATTGTPLASWLHHGTGTGHHREFERGAPEGGAPHQVRPPFAPERSAQCGSPDDPTPDLIPAPPDKEPRGLCGYRVAARARLAPARLRGGSGGRARGRSP